LWRLQVLETARAAFEASSQRVRLTNLSGRRDMSLLLALSATQVRLLRSCTVTLLSSSKQLLLPANAW
jgi:hypothetical protein